MNTEINPYNPLDFFQTNEEVCEYLTQAFMDEDPDMFIIALGHVARHKGIARLAEEAGLNRESLYKTLSGKTQPKWGTVQRIIKALHPSVRVAT